ncbi:hypothetical protein KB559_00160 [Paenibacillus sp. Marseille-P2973]|uniref:hypothetical protein n=1 Tax=Paenibacillus TaxID=44249 RepID=UPI001B37B845|nr:MULTISPECIES: hypothetical protein [Paenibacillus]MBQ4897251.1 hypothetical protein [Paenibacillus sp. Marseille-P2973]MDN4067395.1 hypothetical protein [Paenibacillus vini]
MPDNNDLNLGPHLELLQHPALNKEEQDLIKELIEKTQSLNAENVRLRKTILRLSAGSSPRMSSKLRDALYE